MSDLPKLILLAPAPLKNNSDLTFQKTPRPTFTATEMKIRLAADLFGRRWQAAAKYPTLIMSVNRPWETSSALPKKMEILDAATK